MEGESRPRNQTQKNKRRDRAARMLKQRQAAQSRKLGDLSGEEGDDSPVTEKRPPSRKKKNKEPIFQEDIVDGFAFLCFKSYEDLEKTVNKYDKTDAASAENQQEPPLIDNSLPQLEKQKTKPVTKKNNVIQKVKKKNFLNKVHNSHKDVSSTNDENSRPGEEILDPSRSTSRDQMSDASSHASLEQGYLCDSESGDERASEAECDLFNSKHSDNNFLAKKNNPGHSQNCRSPPILPPIHPVQNGTHHPEPSTAVAAVTASTSPANTVSAMVISATSPCEPQIGSPAVVPISCSSPASPPAGIVPVSPPPFLHKGAPPIAVTNKEASGSKLLSNGYEFVSDTSPPSPIGGAKLLSPNKFLHKRAPPVPLCRENVTAKPAINVYDFVSDHSAPSSPDGVIFLSQSKFHHKGVAPVPTLSKESPTEKISASTVSNGHSVTTNRCSSSPSPVLSSIPSQNHKSVVESTVKMNVSVCKTEPISNVIPTLGSEQHRPLMSPVQTRPPSYNISYSTSQPLRKASPPVVASLPISVSLPSSMSSMPPAPSTSSGSATITTPVSTRASNTTACTTISSAISHSVVGLSCSPVVTMVTTSHPNTPTPVPARDTHSSHSNSSLSSLSQLSTPVHKDREGTASRSHSNSSNNTPSVSVALTSTSAYAATSSLASLVFSKPHSWGSNSNSSVLSTAVSRSSPFPPRSSPSLSTSLPLPPSLPPAHHTSPFGPHPGPPPPPLLPVASHHAMFASPIPPGSLTPTLPLEAPGGPSPYRADSLFPQPNPDLLRRELDTRFLASQDHSIPIPPPPYMQAEVHQHGHMHQQATFIPPPPLGAPMVTQPTPHLYEKYTKLEPALYARPSQIGLSGFPGVSALFAPGGGGASTPFVPPAHLSALQPKMNAVSKNKSMKPGKWCAMHVRIAWEIYNHQQKQKRAEVHKAGMSLASVKPPTEHLHPANHLFSSLPRQHDLSPFSSSLLSAAASAHPRTPFEASSHHSTFLNPSPAHLGPFARPGYPSFGAPGPGFSGLGPLGIPGSSVLGAELRGSCLTQDPWGQRTALSFGGGAPWGGLKEEAEHERLQHERKREEDRQKRAEQERREKELERERREQERREHERREHERREMERREQERKEQERKEKERERREQERREIERREQERREHERREQERQKERDREIRLHHQLSKSSAIVLNGDIRDHHHHPHHTHTHPHHHHVREWERPRDVREVVRSPVQAANSVKYDSALERHMFNQRLDIKVKQERKDDEPVRHVRTSMSGSADERIRKRPSSIPQAEPDGMVHMSRTVPHGSMTLGLNSLDHTRVMGPHGLVPSPSKDALTHSQASSLWGPLTPSPTVTTLASSSVDHYRTREMLQGRVPVSEHERRFDSLASVMSPRDRCSNSELSRQLSAAMDLEHAAAAAAAAYDRSKLLPPPLRTNESPYMTPPALPPVSASSFFSPPVSPYLNSMCSASSRTKAGGPAMLNGIPPPLIPCTFPVQNHTGFPANRTSSPMTHKLGSVSGSGVLNLHESYFTKERREINGHPSDLDAHLRL